MVVDVLLCIITYVCLSLCYCSRALLAQLLTRQAEIQTLVSCYMNMQLLLHYSCVWIDSFQFCDTGCLMKPCIKEESGPYIAYCVV